jgi:photosystem II stability/assembly factor-like uncharacterized protein
MTMKTITFIFLFTLSAGIFSQTWTQQTGPYNNKTFYSTCVIDTNICWMAGDTSVVIRTTNAGANWVSVSSNTIAANLYYIFATDVNHAWTGGDDGSIYYTTNGGTNWHVSVPTPTTPFVDGIHMFNNSIGFAVCDPPTGDSIWAYYTTTNGGVNWIRGANAPHCTNNETGLNSCIWALDTGHIYWGGTASKIYYGGFKGTISSITSPFGNTFGIAFENTSMGVIIGSAATYRTTNGGTNWTIVAGSQGGYGISQAPSYQSYYWIAKGNGTPGGIYRSVDDGQTFAAQITGHHFFSVSTPNVQIGWAGCDSGRIFRYRSNDPIEVKKISTELPNNYSLSQNYPNPFNPSTTIRFSVPLTNLVNIVVYDILGNKVATVLDKRMLAGSYEVGFNASNLSSGVYFYTITAGQFKDSKKMILAK